MSSLKNRAMYITAAWEPFCRGMWQIRRPSFSGFPHYVAIHTLLIISFMREGLLQVSFCLPASKAGGWARDSKHSLDPGGSWPWVPHQLPALSQGPILPHSGLHTLPFWWNNGVKCTNTGWGQCHSSVTAPFQGVLCTRENCLGFLRGPLWRKVEIAKNLSLSSCLYPAEHLDLQGTICISEQGAWCTTQGLVSWITL